MKQFMALLGITLFYACLTGCACTADRCGAPAGKGYAETNQAGLMCGIGGKGNLSDFSGTGTAGCRLDKDIREK